MTDRKVRQSIESTYDSREQTSVVWGSGACPSGRG